MRRACILPILLFSAGCSASNPDIIQVGPWFPSKPSAEVQVLSSREQILKPWGAIAVIHGGKFPAEDKSAIESQKKKARKLAAGIGADGIIITEETTTSDSRLGVYQEPENYISALAFKYVTDVSTAVRR